MTLIEVLAGLALMASVLAGILVIKARVSRHARVLEQREEAVEAADAMLQNWMVEPATVPIAGRGPVIGHPDLTWRTSAVRNPPAESLGGAVVRLEIVGAPETDEALVAVEVIVPTGVKHDAGVHAR